MFKAFARVSSKLDKVQDVSKSLKNLGKMDVLVGIPEGDNGDHDEITNPELMYALTNGVRSDEMISEMQPHLDAGVPYSKAYQMFVHTHGSPLWRIPPRPILEPSIENSKDVIAKQLKKAATTALDGQNPSTELQQAGMLGVNVARDWFTNPKNNWPANADSTIARKGSDRPNIDTGELRKSITYVVRNND